MFTAGSSINRRAARQPLGSRRSHLASSESSTGTSNSLYHELTSFFSGIAISGTSILAPDNRESGERLIHGYSTLFFTSLFLASSDFGECSFWNPLLDAQLPRRLPSRKPLDMFPCRVHKPYREMGCPMGVWKTLFTSRRGMPAASATYNDGRISTKPLNDGILPRPAIGGTP